MTEPQWVTDISLSIIPKDWAITLWPFCFYAPNLIDQECVRVHEHYHWKQALSWGVVPWYLVYIVLWPFYRHNIGAHPLEMPAYAKQHQCEQSNKEVESE